MSHSAPYPFLKGHGTENDFVLLPDHDGSVHEELSPRRVAALCDRRAGIGADGVLRVIRSTALEAGVGQGDAEWFMDYRNADGSVSEMCGNGIRVFARHLIDQGLTTPAAAIAIGTRAGTKLVSVGPAATGGAITVDMGVPELLGESVVGLDRWSWPAHHISMGNPHAVVFVNSLSELGDLAGLTFDSASYPQGVNVEFVTRLAADHIAMRVNERGVGETRSCGTGACAAMVAAAVADGYAPGRSKLAAYDVDVPGGRLSVEWREDGRVYLTGPAVIIAEGLTSL